MERRGKRGREKEQRWEEQGKGGGGWRREEGGEGRRMERGYI